MYLPRVLTEQKEKKSQPSKIKQNFFDQAKTNKTGMRKCTGWLVACASFAASVVGGDRPNIVIVMTDDMGFSDIGSYGSEIPTPHIDSLAKNGIKFSQFYNTGRCSPTRASLLTGMYSHQVGITVLAAQPLWGDPEGRKQELAADVPTLAESLQAAGYYTMMSGKWHLSDLPDTDRKSTPWNRGFDRSFVGMGTGAGQIGFFETPPTYYDYTKKIVIDKYTKLPRFILDGSTLENDDPVFPASWYSTDLITTFALDFLDNRNVRRVKRVRGIRPVDSDTCTTCGQEDAPFFLYLSHFAPHVPLAAPKEDVDLFRGKYTAGWSQLASERLARQKASGLIQGSWPGTSEPYGFDCDACNASGTNGNFDHQMAVYAAMVHRVDVSTGELVKKLKQLNAFDNTLLLFFSDNGGTGEAVKHNGILGKMKGNPTDYTGKWRGAIGWGSFGRHVDPPPTTQACSNSHIRTFAHSHATRTCSPPPER